MTCTMVIARCAVPLTRQLQSFAVVSARRVGSIASPGSTMAMLQAQQSRCVLPSLPAHEKVLMQSVGAPPALGFWAGLGCRAERERAFGCLGSAAVSKPSSARCSVETTWPPSRTALSCQLSCTAIL